MNDICHGSSSCLNLLIIQILITFKNENNFGRAAVLLFQGRELGGSINTVSLYPFCNIFGAVRIISVFSSPVRARLLFVDIILSVRRELYKVRDLIAKQS